MGLYVWRRFVYLLILGSTLYYISIVMEAQPEVKKEESLSKPAEKHHKKGEHHEKKPRPQRPERKNEHEYNAQLIDQNTVIPPLPKKGDIIPKPDIKVYKEREQKNSHRIEELINKKKDIRAEKFKFNRRAQGEGDNAFSAFSAEINEVQQLRDKLAELKVERNKLGDDLHNAIEKAKANNEKLKEYRGALKGSRENFSERLKQLQHIQMTKQLSKNEEKDINNEIMILKRKIREAESSGNIEIKLEQAEDLREELDELINKIKAEKEPIDKEYTAVRDELDKKNKHITDLKGEMAAEKNEKTEEKERHDKEYEAWKENKKKRLDKLEEEINKIRAENNKLWDEYHKKADDHWKQKHLIDFIEWQNRVKNRKIAEKEREAKKAEYEKRDKEREKEAQLQRYIGEIELINFLITYLNNLKGDTVKAAEEKKEVKVDPSEITAKLAADAQWKKERVEIIQPKKSKEDVEPEKKHKKKNKKKEQVKTEQKFTIPFNVQTMFESIKLLAPTSAQEIDAKIKQLRQRESLFQRVAQEESNEEEKKLAEEINEKRNAKQTSKQVKEKKPVQQDFPSI